MALVWILNNQYQDYASILLDSEINWSADCSEIKLMTPFPFNIDFKINDQIYS